MPGLYHFSTMCTESPVPSSASLWLNYGHEPGVCKKLPLPQEKDGVESSSEQDDAIETRELSRRFGDVTAVDSVTLNIPRGIVFGFLGPNGAGKTTMIRLLLGLLEPTGGTARVLGHDLPEGGPEVRERTGALLEHTGLYERLSAIDNLEFYARIWRLNSSERAARIKVLLDRIGLWERRRENVRKWSRGMKQKLAVVRALIHQPRLVFLDEPTAGLDPIAAAELRADLAGLARDEGVTVFLTTHNLAEAEKLCDQVGVIAHGKLLAVGSPEELRDQSKGAELTVVGSSISESLLEKLNRRSDIASATLTPSGLRLALETDASVPDIVRDIVLGGAEIEEVRQGKASLEEAFLELMNSH